MRPPSSRLCGPSWWDPSGPGHPCAWHTRRCGIDGRLTNRRPIGRASGGPIACSGSGGPVAGPVGTPRWCWVGANHGPTRVTGRLWGQSYQEGMRLATVVCASCASTCRKATFVVRHGQLDEPNQGCWVIVACGDGGAVAGAASREGFLLPIAWDRAMGQIILVVGTPSTPAEAFPFSLPTPSSSTETWPRASAQARHHAGYSSPDA
jgi:hypothetical protein